MHSCSSDRRSSAFSFPASLALVLWIGVLNPQVAMDASAQGAWRPEKAVEIILPTVAGGINDQVARLMQKIWQDEKLVRTPECAKYLAEEYRATKAAMADLGLAK